MERTLPIIVYSHLRWSSSFQRPEQLLSRIARSRPVYFFEETLAAEPEVPDSIELRYPQPDVTVIRPILQDPPGAFDVERLAGLAKRFLRWQQIERHVAWLYTPAAAPLAKVLAPQLTVYDRFDAGVERGALGEAELLRDADLVFTVGPVTSWDAAADEMLDELHSAWQMRQRSRGREAALQAPAAS